MPSAALLLALAAAAPARGQEPAATDTVRPAPPAPAPLTLPSGGGPLLDAPVSRSEYRLGPGDVVDVAIFGDYNQVFSISVSPEGSLLVPSLGIARVLGLSLDDAEDQVRALVARYYRNANVRLALARVRTFKVFVVGDVPQPGMRVASAASRVSEVLGDPGQQRDSVAATREPGPRVLRRNVTLRRAGGEEISLDLRRFLQTGDVSSNPFLREGDAIIVPAVDARVETLGRVHFPGAYEYRPGETLAQLLDLANGGGPLPSNAADSLRLVRFDGSQGRTEHRFSREEATGARGRAFVLQPFDAVYVPEVGNYRVQRTARVAGAVLRPGIYPIRPDTTTVRELVAMAGGFAPNASLYEATLRREPPRDVSMRTQMENTPPELLTREERRLIQVRAQGDATTVVVNFEGLFEGGSALDVPVRSGDLLNVPEARNEVTVLGAVRTPGIVPFQPGQPLTHYIRTAGGYSRRADADDIRILKARQGAPVHWRDVQEMEPGDTVIVPFDEQRNWVATLQGVQAVVTGVTGIILAVIAVGSL